MVVDICGEIKFVAPKALSSCFGISISSVGPRHFQCRGPTVLKLTYCIGISKNIVAAAFRLPLSGDLKRLSDNVILSVAKNLINFVLFEILRSLRSLRMTKRTISGVIGQPLKGAATHLGTFSETLLYPRPKFIFFLLFVYDIFTYVKFFSKTHWR